VKNILKYLIITKNVFLIYEEYKLEVQGYLDSFQSDIDDSKSRSRYIFNLNGGGVNWKGYKQETITNSITEAEYISIFDAEKKVVWIKKLITKLGVVSNVITQFLTPCFF